MIRVDSRFEPGILELALRYIRWGTPPRQNMLVKSNGQKSCLFHFVSEVDSIGSGLMRPLASVTAAAYTGVHAAAEET